MNKDKVREAVALLKERLPYGVKMAEELDKHFTATEKMASLSFQADKKLCIESLQTLIDLAQKYLDEEIVEKE